MVTEELLEKLAQAMTEEQVNRAIAVSLRQVGDWTLDQLIEFAKGEIAENVLRQVHDEGSNGRREFFADLEDEEIEEIAGSSIL